MGRAAGGIRQQDGTARAEVGVARRLGGLEQAAAPAQEQFDQEQKFPPFFDAEELLHVPCKIRVQPLIVEAGVELGRQEGLRQAAAQ